MKTGAKFCVPAIVIYILFQIISAIARVDLSGIGNLLMGCWTGYMGMTMRKKYRQKWGYDADDGKDFCCYFCCEPCSVGQDSLEAKKKAATSPGSPPQPSAPQEEALPVAEAVVEPKADVEMKVKEIA